MRLFFFHIFNHVSILALQVCISYFCFGYLANELFFRSCKIKWYKYWEKLMYESEIES